jgi:hypothetical protein
MERRKQGRQLRDEDEDQNPADREQKKRKNYRGKEAGNALEKVSDLCPLAPLSFARMNMCHTLLTWTEQYPPFFFSVSVSVFCGGTDARHIASVGKSKMPREGKLFSEFLVFPSRHVLRVWRC